MNYRDDSTPAGADFAAARRRRRRNENRRIELLRIAVRGGADPAPLRIAYVDKALRETRKAEGT